MPDTTMTTPVGSISSLQNMGFSLWTDPINNGVVFQYSLECGTPSTIAGDHGWDCYDTTT